MYYCKKDNNIALKIQMYNMHQISASVTREKLADVNVQTKLKV